MLLLCLSAHVITCVKVAPDVYPAPSPGSGSLGGFPRVSHWPVNGTLCAAQDKRDMKFQAAFLLILLRNKNVLLLVYMSFSVLFFAKAAVIFSFCQKRFFFISLQKVHVIVGVVFTLYDQGCSIFIIRKNTVQE